LDLARVLLARAEDDETLVRKVSSDADIADAIVGFHAQQTAEKSIKAVLAARGVSFTRSHALGYLIGLVEENEIEGPDEISEADVLSPWAVEFRTREKRHPLSRQVGCSQAHRRVEVLGRTRGRGCGSTIEVRGEARTRKGAAVGSYDAQIPLLTRISFLA
jgi:HEPN domain-containing protein